MSRIPRIAAASGLMLLAGMAQGQQAPEADPLYHVEIIVFENLETNRIEEDFFHGRESLGDGPALPLLRLPNIDLEQVSVRESPAVFGDETPAPLESQIAPDGLSLPSALDADQASPDSLTADSLTQFELDGESSGAAGTDASPAQLDGFRILGRSELELVSAAQRMERLSAYRVIAHVGWVQAGVGPERAPKIDLARLGVTNPTGTIQINRQRFLHAIVDLTYRDGRGSFWRPGNQFGLRRLEYAPSYRHTHERNAIYSGELHHIDHPLFGIILRITPAPEPEKEEVIDPESGGPAA